MPPYRETGKGEWDCGYHGDMYVLSVCLTVVLPVALYGQKSAGFRGICSKIRPEESTSHRELL